MKTIGIGLQKGGVGKTSISIALANELAKEHKVLLIDADPQGNATSALLSDIGKYEFADVLLERCNDIREVATQTDNENLYIIPTFPIGTHLREYKASGKVNEDTFEIDNQLKKISEYFDYCIIDTSPDFSIFERNCYYACDEIIPIVNCDSFANDGLFIFTNNIAKFKEKMRKENLIMKNIVINRYNASLSINVAIKDIIEKNNNFNYITVPQDQCFMRGQLEVKVIEGKPATKEAIKKLAELIK